MVSSLFVNRLLPFRCVHDVGPVNDGLGKVDKDGKLHQQLPTPHDFFTLELTYGMVKVINCNLASCVKVFAVHKWPRRNLVANLFTFESPTIAMRKFSEAPLNCIDSRL